MFSACSSDARHDFGQARLSSQETLARKGVAPRAHLQADADAPPLAAADALHAQRLVADQRVLAGRQVLRR